MRRGVALAAVAFLLVVAGCGEPVVRQTAQTVTPTATVTPAGDGYEVSITLNSTVEERSGPAPLNLSGTRVVAYDATGERLCAVETGDLSAGGRVTATTTCPDHPAVLVPGAVDCDAEVVRKTETVTALSSVDYRATRFTPFRTPAYQPFAEACGGPPGREAFVELQCRYFTTSVALPFERRPWTEWERLPPEADRSFRLRVENRTLGDGEISVGPGGPENPPIGRPRFTVGEDAPPLAERLVTLGREDPVSPYQKEVSAAEFFRAYRTLTGYDVNDTDDLPRPGVFADGTVGVDDYGSQRGEVQCGGDAGDLLTYTGNYGYRTEVHVAGGDGTEWDIQLDYSYRASGPAIANRSAVVTGAAPTDTATGATPETTTANRSTATTPDGTATTDAGGTSTGTTTDPATNTGDADG